MELLNPLIFDQIQVGDSAAFATLFDEAYLPLCFFANQYLCDMDLSRSLVQEVFVDLWVKRERLNIRSSAKSYMFYSVKNRCIDYIRKEKKTIRVSEIHENLCAIPFRDLMGEAELNDRINSAIQGLPEKCRQIFLLCRVEGLKYAEIAEKLQLSVKTVEMQMGIALKKLRVKLSDYQMI